MLVRFKYMDTAEGKLETFLVDYKTQQAKNRKLQ